ncbi:MAG: GAF and ANTAR domain-containing protein [Frankiaceae bacterium]|nr:GAF and ANTAR domain-containing protein [Frankiaceae bacterium]
MPPTATLAHPTIDAVLSTAATLLGMEVVFVGGVTEDSFVFERIRTADGLTWAIPTEGDVLDLASTLCDRMLNGAPPTTSDAASDPIYSQPAARELYGITSYVGVPIRDGSGRIVGTLCGIDRGRVTVPSDAIAVLSQLAEVVSAHVDRLIDDGIVIRRSSEGGWAVGGDTTSDLTSAMVLADLLAGELQPGARPARTEQPLDEVGQLRLSVKQLEHALAARVVVEQAIGVLTERQHSTPRDAFERLRKVARSRGRKVHDLAKEVVMSANDPAVPLPPELAGRR